MQSGWERNPSIKKIREFALLVGGVLVVVGAIIHWRHPDRPSWVWFVGTGGTLALLGVIIPGILKPVYQIWMAVAFQLSRVMTTVLLSILYFIAFGVMGLILRIFGKDPLNRRWAPGTSATHWRDREVLPAKDRDLKPY